jgi:hypothetical protein
MSIIDATFILKEDLEQIEYVFETYAGALTPQRDGHPDYIFDQEEGKKI